jgi:hypothetical protein
MRKPLQKSTRAPIQWAYFNSNQYHPGRPVACGEDGIAFIADVNLRPGTPLFIKKGQAPADASTTVIYHAVPTAGVAEVKSCREAMDPGADGYEIRVRFPGRYYYG